MAIIFVITLYLLGAIQTHVKYRNILNTNPFFSISSKLRLVTILSMLHVYKMPIRVPIPEMRHLQ